MNRAGNRAGTVLEALTDVRPVLDRELRQRSRTARSMVVMTVFLLLALGVAFITYTGETASFNSEFGIARQNVGRSVFEWVLILELVLLLFVVPGISAGAITGERDRQTLIPLQVTLIGPFGIFFGKVLASSAFVLLLVVATAPILAMAYLLGGVAFGQIVSGILALLLIGFLLAVLGVACSAMLRRTAAATLIAYGVILVLCVGTAVVFAVLMVLYAVGNNGNSPDSVLAYLTPFYWNPFVLLAGAAGEVSDVNGPWPLSGIRTGFIEAQDVNQRFRGDILIEEPGFAGAFNERPGELAVIPLWLRSSLALVWISVMAAMLGVRRLRTPSRSVSQ
ncbi:MAG: ABC transporter permease [Acidimicrobiia bacterium]|nr:ABC transporter permease [Acidimicrobiia bacterium]